MEKFKNIILLAGGKSTRFWPLSDKNLFSFLGKTITEHQIERFLPYAQKLTIVANSENRTAIQEITQKFNAKNIQVVTQTGEGQGAALLSCRGLVSGEALVLNNDDFFEYEKLLEKILQNKEKYHLMLTAKQVTDYLPGGYLKVEKDTIQEVIEKPGSKNMPSHLFRLVVDYYLDFDLLLQEIAKVKTDHDDYFEKAINKYINKYINAINKYLNVENQKSNKYLEYDGEYYTLKFPYQVFSVMDYFLSQLKNDEIRTGKNVKIAPTAKVVGPTYIGDNTVIGDFAMVRNSHIGANCLIGGYCEVTRSYIADKVMLHRNYVGDSVLDKEVLMGAQAVTANFRFDGKTIGDSKRQKLGAIIGKNVKVGVGAVLLPGVKIGAGSFIGPGELIAKDVNEKRFIYQNKDKKNLL